MGFDYFLFGGSPEEINYTDNDGKVITARVPIINAIRVKKGKDPPPFLAVKEENGSESIVHMNKLHLVWKAWKVFHPIPQKDEKENTAPAVQCHRRRDLPIVFILTEEAPKKKKEKGRRNKKSVAKDNQDHHHATLFTLKQDYDNPRRIQFWTSDNFRAPWLSDENLRTFQELRSRYYQLHTNMLPGGTEDIIANNYDHFCASCKNEHLKRVRHQMDLQEAGYTMEDLAEIVVTKIYLNTTNQNISDSFVKNPKVNEYYGEAYTVI